MEGLQQIIVLFRDAFDQVQVHLSWGKIEDLAIIVHKAMSADSRLYHRQEHIFALADASDPLQTLAALFHDLIYYHVDEGFPPGLAPVLTPYMQEKHGNFFLPDTIDPDDKLFRLTLEVFGFEAGQQLPLYGGLNEFLSALVMNRTLETILSEEILLQLTVYIEATIPFRGENARGKGFPEILETRLHNIVNACHIPMSPEKIESIVMRAVLFANKDVKIFSEPDPAKFLDTTWELLPETNRALRSKEQYTIRDYRRAIQKTEILYKALNPELIFHQYRDVPPEAEFQGMVKQTYKNLHVAREYLGLKILAIAIFEALAEVSGGNVPISLFMGDIRQSIHSLQTLENYTSGLEVSTSFNPSSPVFTLMDCGRTSEIYFDIRKSPFAAFLYKYQETAALKGLLKNAKAMFDGQLSHQEFLEGIEPAVLSVLARTCALKALTRQEQLLQYVST
ncbi:MAG: hypothetical protein GY801_15015 [bacterium]|nr:hypothetical protein [bacterium]